MQDQDSIISDSFLSASSRRRTSNPTMPTPRPPPGIVRRLIHRFVLGLPIVGASSLVHMLLSMPLIGPVHWLARYRGNRNRRGNSRDIAAILVIVLLVAGAARPVLSPVRITSTHSLPTQGNIQSIRAYAENDKAAASPCRRRDSRSELSSACMWFWNVYTNQSLFYSFVVMEQT